MKWWRYYLQAGCNSDQPNPIKNLVRSTPINSSMPVTLNSLKMQVSGRFLQQDITGSKTDSFRTRIERLYGSCWLKIVWTHLGQCTTSMAASRKKSLPAHEEYQTLSLWASCHVEIPTTKIADRSWPHEERDESNNLSRAAASWSPQQQPGHRLPISHIFFISWSMIPAHGKQPNH